jgi:hypothetical protein
LTPCRRIGRTSALSPRCTGWSATGIRVAASGAVGQQAANCGKCVRDECKSRRAKAVIVHRVDLLAGRDPLTRRRLRPFGHRQHEQGERAAGQQHARPVEPSGTVGPVSDRSFQVLGKTEHLVRGGRTAVGR